MFDTFIPKVQNFVPVNTNLHICTILLVVSNIRYCQLGTISAYKLQNLVLIKCHSSQNCRKLYLQTIVTLRYRLLWGLNASTSNSCRQGCTQDIWHGVQWNLSTTDTLGTTWSILVKEVFLFQRLLSTLVYVAGTTGRHGVLIREVSLVRRSLIEVPLYTRFHTYILYSTVFKISYLNCETPAGARCESGMSEGSTRVPRITTTL